jgi:hypothetical protein
MDNDTLALLAKFTIHARSTIGVVDSNLFINDEIYRNEIFRRVDTQANEELLLMAFTLRQRMAAHQKEQEAAKVEADSAAKNKKYLFGARG